MIKVENVSMEYKMELNAGKSIKEYIVKLINGNLKYKYFKALDNVSFTVDRGEVVGIIGGNGAGKSTMLKIISGILKPTKGKVTINANVVPMLELGCGFDMELSGRENVFLNGAILGYSKEFLNSKYDEIIEFSGVEHFIENPIRTYSSGMIVRLAFSIATVVNPEILIVDEILSVGDAEFLKKSRERMISLIHSGATVFIVSHDVDTINSLCTKVIWLEHGKLKKIGTAEALVAEYISEMI